MQPEVLRPHSASLLPRHPCDPQAGVHEAAKGKSSSNRPDERVLGVLVGLGEREGGTIAFYSGNECLRAGRRMPEVDLPWAEVWYLYDHVSLLSDFYERHTLRRGRERGV